MGQAGVPKKRSSSLITEIGVNGVEMSGLTREVLSQADIGLWSVVGVRNNPPKLCGDDKMLELLGADSYQSPEELFRLLFDNIDSEYREATNRFVEDLIRGRRAEVIFAWHHPTRGLIYVRCVGARDLFFTGGSRFEGCHQDVTELVQIRQKAEQTDLFSDITKSLSQDYYSIVYVDVRDNSYVKVNNRDLRKIGATLDGDDYFECARRNIRKFVFEEDVEPMLAFFQKENILREIRYSPCITRTMRVVVDGRPVYFRSKVMRSSTDDFHLVFAMENIDEEEQIKNDAKREELYRNNVIQILARRFTGLYLFNIGDKVKSDFQSQYDVSEGTFSDENLQETMLRFVHTMVHPDDRKMLEDIFADDEIKRRLAHKKSFTVVFRRDYDGEYKYTEMLVAKVEAHDEPPVNIAVGFVENDEEVRAAMDRKKIAERDMAVISGLSDDFGCVVYVNSTTGKEIRYRLNAMFLKQIPQWMEIDNFWVRLKAAGENIVHPEDRDSFFEMVSKERIEAALSQEKIYFVNFRLLMDDEVVYYQGKFVRDEKRKDHFIAGFHSVDEETRREMAALKKAETASRAKTSFLFNMSHDIRTPMNAIMGFTNMAIKNLDDKEKVVDCLQKTQISSEHLLSLINDILDLSRIESGKLDINEVPVDLIQCIRESCPMLTSLAEKKQIQMLFDYEKVKDNFVYMDSLHVMQVIINLASNAVKYTQTGGEVRMGMEQLPCNREGYALYSITVSDNGIGMSEEFLTHVFDQFAREKSLSVNKQQGTGLGLAITKNLVEMMGGKIEVQSLLGKGSTFKVTLPLRLQECPEENEQMHMVSVSTEKYNFKGKRLLVVEDNELNREISEDVLVGVGFKVDLVEDGSVAVHRVLEKGPNYYDCILMDVQMPVMDGYEATRIIRNMYPNKRIPIVALSANAFEEDRQRSLEAGMDDHQSKPIVLSQLLESLNKLFLKKSSEKR